MLGVSSMLMNLQNILSPFKQKQKKNKIIDWSVD